MRIIIIGASGLIGSHLFSIAKATNQKVIGTYNGNPKKDLVQFNMLTESINTVIKDLNQNDTVFLLSAYSNPSWIYNNLKQARQLNLFATKRVIDDVFKAGARLVFMSSVEVFDGENGNYHEESFLNPLNEYGKMKHEIEKYLTQAEGNSCIIRTGWNVGWSLNQRCVVKLMYETLLKPNAKMAKDNIFSIIDVKDTAEGLFGIFKNLSVKKCHFASDPFIVRTELADMVISNSKYGNQMSYKPVLFSNIQYSEPRGRLNHLDNLFSKKFLKMKYTMPEEIIRKKVRLLDENFSKIQNV